MNTTIKKLKQKLKIEEEKLQKQQAVVKQLKQKIDDELHKQFENELNKYAVNLEQVIDLMSKTYGTEEEW